MRAVLADLFAGASCPGCRAPGELPCRGCAARLRGRTAQVPALADGWSAGAYEGLLRQLILGHKERQQYGLRGVLGRLLADAVAALLADAAVQRVLLVPVPSRGSAVRSRGYDPTAVLTRQAAAALRQQGIAAGSAPLLRVRRVRDQEGLSREQRAANLTGAMSCRPSALARLQGEAVWAVICDDVVTTGATVTEARRALGGVGVGVLGVAAVAHTPRATPHPLSG